MTQNKSYLIKSIVCVASVLLMVGAAELLNENEIIFPEIAALAVGAIAAPEQTWQTNRIRMVFLIALCSVIGILTSMFSPLPKALNLIIAYAVCQVIYMLSGTGFTPMISAALLPILMETKTIIYPVSAIVMTVLTVLSQYALEKAHLHNKTEFVPIGKPCKSDVLTAGIRTAVISVMAVPMISFGFQFVIAPPLIVAFTEFTNPKSKAREKCIETVLVITGCAVAGTVSRLIVTERFGLPLLLSAVMAMFFVLILMKAVRLFVPPAAALAILPMIIPQDALIIYPFEILIGVSVFMAVSKLLFIKR